MKGDFSQWRFDPRENFNGVLHQQGRVLLDADWNEQTRIQTHWQRRAGRDVIGPAVAAVPASEPDGFQIVAADVVNAGGIDHVELQVHPGHVWADGWLAYLAGELPNLSAPVMRVAAYLPPPIQNPPFTEASIAVGIRDAVILEVSQETMNGFQVPDRLIEPALGGPDTTERVHTCLAFKLYRLQPGEDCHSIYDQLQDDPAAKGTLTVELQPTQVVAGDCPVVEGGGYTGFEHHLYRIEIAETAAPDAMFKWSQFNGGLVGRGQFIAGTPNRVTITANQTAIVTSGLTEFYLEALQYSAEHGHWRIVYGTMATLNNQQELELDATSVFGVFPASADPVFFRLWNGIEPIADYTDTVNPGELRDGILLTFDAPAGGNYRPGDYWTFPVRAGEIQNAQTLIDHQLPQGIQYHRVPLAEIAWNTARSVTTPAGIEDCRRRFPPLTRLESCCTFRVGDGLNSFGDFNSIQAAIDALPAEGGQICVLSGMFTENIGMRNRRNITILGCGWRSQIVSGIPAGEFAEAAPVIRVEGGRNIMIADLAIVAHSSGIGLDLEGADPNFGDDQQVPFPLRRVTLQGLMVAAAGQSAVRVRQVRGLVMQDCHVVMDDVVCLDPAVFLLGDNQLVEHNLIEAPARAQTDLALTAAVIPPEVFPPGSNTRGGLQIGGTSDRVRIIDNLIRGGSGNGITLGSLIFIDEYEEPVPPKLWPRPRPIDPCEPRDPANSMIIVSIDTGIPGETRPASAGALSEIQIERNRIQHMGMNGIGVAGFFDLENVDEFISVENLGILGNEIQQCLRRPIADISAERVDSVGYGGISLADVEHLVLQDNRIADNGPSHVEPICGIFVLHAEGMDVSRNRILNNGAKTGQSTARTKIGRRGGINVVYAVAPVTPVQVNEQIFQGQNGVPALKVHDNIVSVPVGQALSVTALGPLSVADNQFTSQGLVQSGRTSTFYAATVAVFNLGLSNEFYLQYLAYQAIRNGAFRPSSAFSSGTSQPAVLQPAPGLADRRLGQLLANGNVMFAGNQVHLDLFESGATLSVSSIAIVTLDDLSFHGNQCDCNLSDDVVLAQAIMFGVSLRVNDNRFKETLVHALFSLVTMGALNMTANNQGTHCFLIRPKQSASPYTIDEPNTILVDPSGSGYCERWPNLLGNFGKMTHVNQG